MRDPGRHQGPLPRREGHVDGRDTGRRRRRRGGRTTGAAAPGRAAGRAMSTTVGDPTRRPCVRRPADRLLPRAARPRARCATTSGSARAAALVGAGDDVPGHALAGVRGGHPAVAGVDGHRRRCCRGRPSVSWRTRRRRASRSRTAGSARRPRADPAATSSAPPSRWTREQTRRVAGVGRRRPRLPAAPALPQAPRAGDGARPGDPAPYWLVEHPAPGPARRRAARRSADRHSEA